MTANAIQVPAGANGEGNPENRELNGKGNVRLVV
jgi:hypothetical protein